MTATSEIEAGHLDAKSGSAARVGELPKAPTGISGLDEVTGGGLPRGLSLKTLVGNGEHNRVLHVRKSRGMAHSNQIREFLLAGHYEIEIIDLVEHPSLARGDDILAIPTLVGRRPEPSRKIIGDLSDTERVLVGLRLQPGSSR